MRGTGGPSTAHEPLVSLLAAGAASGEGPPAAVLARAARALLDLPAVPPVAGPSWLAPHQRPAAIRLTSILARYGGAVLADAPGLGKSYVAMAVASMHGGALTLVVPAVLVGQWRLVCRRFGTTPEVFTHESLSRHPARSRGSLLIVDEAHHFRNPATRRYRALAGLAPGVPLLLVTATPVHNHIGDLIHLLRLFLRDDCLAGLGVPSLKRAAAGESWTALPGALARLVVARSRARAPSLALPRRARGQAIRVGPAPEPQLRELVEEIGRYSPGPAGALVRMVLLTRLASSLAAFRESLSRQEAFADLAAEARQAGRTLTRRDFQRLFPRGEEPDLQLALLPLLLPRGNGGEGPGDHGALARLREHARTSSDPKVARLHQLLTERPARTLVFTSSRATARHLLRCLKSAHRVAAVMGARGLWATGPAPVDEVLRAFAPAAAGAPEPPPALRIGVLVATDLASEGLNLQDASRVVNYDLPWTPARLAQRVGRIDRLGSPHARIQVVTLLPPAPLAQAIKAEARLAAKARVGRRAALFDWCDRLQTLAARDGAGVVCAVNGDRPATVLVVSVGGVAAPVVVRPAGVTTDPLEACRILEGAADAPAVPFDSGDFAAALTRAVPAIRRRLDLLAWSRWRAPDRDQLSRRLIPMVVAAARAAARLGDAPRVARLDRLVGRLGAGMTAGEAFSLDSLADSPLPLTVDRLCEWSERLPPTGSRPVAPELRLVAGIVVRPSGSD